jgi:hypothetical protein
MNPEAQAVLNRILNKALHELTPTDKQFLYARRSYLGERSKKKFATVLKEMEKANPTPPAPRHVETEDDGEVEEVFAPATGDDGEDEAVG